MSELVSNPCKASPNNELQEQITNIISDRLAILTSQSLFGDAQLTYSNDIGRTAESMRTGSTTTVTFPASATRQKQMDFSFDVSHDSDVEHAVIEYRSQILPIFVKFVSQDQLPLSITHLTDSEVVSWVDAKLVGFVETYFEVFFHPEYQKPHIVLDPVTGFPFPKAMAAGIGNVNGRTLHFFTEESCRQFIEDPSHYLGTSFDPTAEKACIEMAVQEFEP